MHHFYYDESEHSRKINDKTIKSNNYYDNFVSVIVGWPKQKERTVFEKYQSFEAKYAERKDKNGELKSKTLKKNQFEFGFASMTKPNVQFVNDFLSLFDEDINFYFSIASKIEYLVLQLFSEYRSNFFFDADAMKYSITKALVVYRPEKVITCLFNSSLYRDHSTSGIPYAFTIKFSLWIQVSNSFLSNSTPYISLFKPHDIASGEIPAKILSSIYLFTIAITILPEPNEFSRIFLPAKAFL